jgi:histidyl-tRNA synthetase
MSEQIKSVRGMRDILPEEIEVWQSVEAIIFKTLESFGFEEIRLPIVEDLRLFQRSVGSYTDIVQKEMYVFQDKAGRHLALRPEATASVVRAYLEHQIYLKKKITRLYYSGPMFRYDRPQKDRYRQFYQIGAEIFGGSSPYFDVEMIIILSKIFNLIGISEYLFEINSVGCNICKIKYETKLKEFLELNKDQMCQDCKLRMQHNVLRVLDCKLDTCRKIIRNAPTIENFLCNDCIKHQEAVYTVLDKRHINYEKNQYLVRGLDYYTKIVFELKIKNEENSVAGGGRYDNLVKELGGPETPAVGFAIGMDRLCSILNGDLCIKNKILIVFLDKQSIEAGMPIIDNSRISGIRISADYSERSLKSHLKNADRENINNVLILGENELEKKCFLYKNMRDGSQKYIKFDELSNFFKELKNVKDSHMRTD